jgi:ferric-dicitrate binding protein FerR (iron transport regulator)
MENSDDKLFARIHSLALAQLDESLTPLQHQELESLLAESATARRLYASYFKQTACLRWLCLEQLAMTSDRAAQDPASIEPATAGRRAKSWAIAAGLACTLALVAIGWQLLGVGKPASFAENPLASSNRDAARQTAAGAGEVATITGLRDVRWSHDDDTDRLLSRCRVGDELQLQAGAAELTFDAGVQLTVFGPAQFEITSATSIRCVRGRITTLVNERGKGFSIETPQAKVVDLGTQFGLDISEDGQTQVVVFQGSVDLTCSNENAANKPPTRRLEQGDALLVDKSGDFRRIVSVERNQFLAAVDGIQYSSDRPVVVDVQDNIRKRENVKSYQIVHGGLQEDALCFVDRDHEWNGMDDGGLPAFLAGADYIMPFNDDKFVRDLEITVRLAGPATLYVFLDNNMEAPRWLREGFTDTGLDIGLDGAKTEWHPANSLGSGAGRSIDFPFSVWKREVKHAGSVALGGIEPPDVRSRGFNMYGIAAVAAE